MPRVISPIIYSPLLILVLLGLITLPQNPSTSHYWVSIVSVCLFSVLFFFDYQRLFAKTFNIGIMKNFAIAIFSLVSASVVSGILMLSVYPFTGQRSVEFAVIGAIAFGGIAYAVRLQSHYGGLRVFDGMKGALGGAIIGGGLFFIVSKLAYTL